MIDLWMEIGGMSLSEFEQRHTWQELEEIAALSGVKAEEQKREETRRRVEQQAQANRGKA